MVAIVLSLTACHTVLLTVNQAAVSFINPLETLNDNDLYKEVETLYKVDNFLEL